MTAAILSIRGLAKRFGANVVSGNIDLDLVTNEVHAVIGPNGAGKTTLINQVIGELTPRIVSVLPNHFSLSRLHGARERVDRRTRT